MKLAKESGLLKKIIAHAKPNCLITICIQNVGNKLKMLNETINFQGVLERIFEQRLEYKFQDSQTNHTSVTEYKMIVVRTPSR